MAVAVQLNQSHCSADLTQKHLKELDLIGSQVNDATVRAFASLALSKLNLTNTTVSEIAIDHLKSSLPGVEINR